MLAAPVTGRLAPTPSGQLHLGNAVAFAAAWLSVRAQGGRVLLRVEDVDSGRARVDLADGLRRDLAWLGLDWDQETRPQSERDYAPWLAKLHPAYFCRCTRQMLKGGGYPGTCRDAGHEEGAVRFRLPEGRVRFADRRWGLRDIDPAEFGDPVLRRRDGVFTYNLAVVADDIADGVSEVVRGADLLGYTGVQIRLWEAFGATPPQFTHAPLVIGPDHRKLSKSHGSVAIAALKAAGWAPSDVWRTVLPWLGIEVDSLAAAIPRYDPARGPRGPIRITESGPSCPDPRLGVSSVDDGAEERT